MVLTFHLCHLCCHLTNFEIFLTRIHIFNAFFFSETEIINYLSSVLIYCYRKQAFKLFLFPFTTEDHSERKSTCLPSLFFKVVLRSFWNNMKDLPNQDNFASYSTISFFPIVRLNLHDILQSQSVVLYVGIQAVPKIHTLLSKCKTRISQ